MTNNLLRRLRAIPIGVAVKDTAMNTNTSLSRAAREHRAQRTQAMQTMLAHHAPAARSLAKLLAAGSSITEWGPHRGERATVIALMRVAGLIDFDGFLTSAGYDFRSEVRS